MAPASRYITCVVVAALVAGPVGRGGGVEAQRVTRKSDEERRAEYERFVDKMMDAMPAEDLAEELVQVIHRTMDAERQQRRKRELDRDFDPDDEALLERIGRLVVKWVNTRLTPRTDEDCKWNWGRWRCDPQCNCHYKYRFGDYAPGRSCRLRPEGERGLDTCDPDRGNDVSLLEKLGAFMGKAAKRTWRFTAEHVVPQTDKDCRFSLAHTLEEKKPICSPRKYCAFHYKFGDVHPGRSCRLRESGESEKGLERTSGSDGKAIDAGGSGSSSGSSGGEEGEGWSMFDWGDGKGSSSMGDVSEEDFYDEWDDSGAWATKGRFWRDSDDGDDGEEEEDAHREL
ncbi:unnamed protein product [Scytosiphon promiscuus]